MKRVGKGKGGGCENTLAVHLDSWISATPFPGSFYHLPSLWHAERGVRQSLNGCGALCLSVRQALASSFTPCSARFQGPSLPQVHRKMGNCSFKLRLLSLGSTCVSSLAMDRQYTTPFLSTLGSMGIDHTASVSHEERMDEALDHSISCP